MKKFIFLVLSFLFINLSVKAENVTLVKERFDDTYVYYYDSNYDRTRYLYANKYVFGDIVAYCVELGKDIDSNIYQVTDDLSRLNISDSDLEFIRLAGYYGYDYPGHNTDRYYMATQELIWRQLAKTSIKWTLGFDPDVFVNISSEKDEIYTLVYNHKRLPSFDGQEIEVVLGEETILEDTNKVLSRFISDTEGVIINGNKLIIKDTFKGGEIILKKPNYNNKNFLVYTSGLSQKMVSIGGIEEVMSKIKTKIVSGSLSIRKLDKDNNSDTPSGEATLNGAIYELFDEDGKVVDTLVIGKKETIDNLPLGKYYLKEKEASKGYLLDNNTYEIEITKDNLDIAIDVYEEVIKRKVDIFKVFASDETGILVGEPNITFEIYDRDDKLYDSITTDKEGYASIVLPYGTYIFKQVNSTDNYYKVDDFKVTISEYDERPIYKLIANSEIKSRLKVIKKDADTGENVVNGKARFKIFDVDNNKFVSFDSVYPETISIDEFEIDENGIFVTPMELHSGNYILYEVDDKMDGYLFNDEGIPFLIGDDTTLINDSVYGTIIEIPFYNKRVKGSIEILKYGEDVVYENNSYYYREILLDNVCFSVYAGEDIYENARLIYEKDTLIGQIVTDKNGLGKIDYLPLGKYYIEEVSSSNGNTISDRRYDVVLGYKDQYTETVYAKLTINNYLTKGRLAINKLETSTDKVIPNTLIEIHSVKGDIVYKEYTDKNGQIVIDDLLYGEYYLSEVEASTGYRLLEDKIYFEIDKDNTEINVYNDRLEVPNTGIDVRLYNLLFTFLGIVGLLMVLFFRKRAAAVFSVVLMLSSVGYFTLSFYHYFKDRSANEKSVSYYLEKKENKINDDRYSYVAVLDIPSVDVKRGILNIDNKYNDVKYNIELIDYNDNTIVLASHNGNNYNSYFGNLNKLELGDEINLYYKGKLYKYVYSDNYTIVKNGYASIYKDENRKSIVLITCKDGSNDGQSVYIGYLKEVSSY